MVPNLESKVLQSMGNTGLVLEPASGLDQESNGGSGLAIVNSRDLDTAGRVDNGSERACKTRGVANCGGRCSQHCGREENGGRVWMRKGGNGNRRRMLVGGRLKSASLDALPLVPALPDAHSGN